jgi:hypothetical protein
MRPRHRTSNSKHRENKNVDPQSGRQVEVAVRNNYRSKPRCLESLREKKGTRRTRTTRHLPKLASTRATGSRLNCASDFSPRSTRSFRAPATATFTIRRRRRRCPSPGRSSKPT